MPYMSTSTVTISKEDGKLVVVRRPVVQTWRDDYRGCFWLIVIFVGIMAFSLTMSFFHILRNSGEEEAYAFLLSIVVVIFAVVVGITVLVISSAQRRRNEARPIDFNDEILTFDTDKFLVKYQEMVSVFSYRHDAKPVLRCCSHQLWYADVLIPCHPRRSIVPSEFRGGYYEMDFVEQTDAKRILAALREYFEMIEPSHETRLK